MRYVIITNTWPRAQVVAEENGIRKGKVWWVNETDQIRGISRTIPVIIDMHNAPALPHWAELRAYVGTYGFLDVTRYTSPRPKK